MVKVAQVGYFCEAERLVYQFSFLFQQIPSDFLLPLNTSAALNFTHRKVARRYRHGQEAVKEDVQSG